MIALLVASSISLALLRVIACADDLVIRVGPAEVHVTKLIFLGMSSICL